MPSNMDAQSILLSIEIRQLMTQLSLGAPASSGHEWLPVCIDATIRARVPAMPQSIEDCMNYQPICCWMVEQWPQQARAATPEAALLVLLAYLFEADRRIESIALSMTALAELPEAVSAVTCLEKSRQEHEAMLPGE